MEQEGASETTFSTKKRKLDEVLLSDDSEATGHDEDESQARNPVRMDQAERWRFRLEELKEFKAAHGHCNVPAIYDDNEALAKWVKRQRYQGKLQKAGRRSTLTSRRREILDQVGFVWNPHKSGWEERFEEMLDFQKKFGHANIPVQLPQNKSLGLWAKSQRRQFKLYCQKGPEGSYLTWPKLVRLMNHNFVFDPKEWTRNRQLEEPLTSKELTLKMIPKPFQLDLSPKAKPPVASETDPTITGKEKRSAARKNDVHKNLASGDISRLDEAVRQPASFAINAMASAASQASGGLGALPTATMASPFDYGSAVRAGGVQLPLPMLIPNMMVHPNAIARASTNTDEIIGRYGRLISSLDVTRAGIIAAMSAELNAAAAGTPTPPETTRAGIIAALSGELNGAAVGTPAIPDTESVRILAALSAELNGAAAAGTPAPHPANFARHFSSQSK